MIRTPENPSGLLEGSIENFVTDNKVNKDELQRVLFSQQTYWTEKKVEYLKEDSQLSKRISWPISELNDNARSV